MIVIHPYGYVRNITYPQLIRSCRDKVLDNIGECGQSMSGVGCTWLAYFQSDFQIISVDDVRKSVSTDRFIPGELMLVHIPEFVSSNTRIFLSDSANILQHKGFLCSLQ